MVFHAHPVIRIPYSVHSLDAYLDMLWIWTFVVGAWGSPFGIFCRPNFAEGAELPDKPANRLQGDEADLSSRTAVLERIDVKAGSDAHELTGGLLILLISLISLISACSSGTHNCRSIMDGFM
jgi:hypothetical protein